MGMYLKQKMEVFMAKKNKRELRREKQMHEQRNKTLLRIGVVTLILFAVLYTFISRPQAVELDASRLASNPTQGTDSPQVTIVEYGDFGCHACQVWHEAGIRDRIMAEYGDRVQFVWKDFAVITAQSHKAAEAGQCAHDQGMFWEYHDVLYENAPAIRVSDLKAYAKQIGLDTGQFNQCLDSGQYKAMVDQDRIEAGRLGLRGTPSFLVNDQRLAGPPMYETLKSILDEALATN
jgi:protein-disulfide isomerase